MCFQLLHFLILQCLVVPLLILFASPCFLAFLHIIHSTILNWYFCHHLPEALFARSSVSNRPIAGFLPSPVLFLLARFGSYPVAHFDRCALSGCRLFHIHLDTQGGRFHHHLPNQTDDPMEVHVVNIRWFREPPICFFRLGSILWHQA